MSPVDVTCLLQNSINEAHFILGIWSLHRCEWHGELVGRIGSSLAASVNASLALLRIESNHEHKNDLPKWYAWLPTRRSSVGVRTSRANHLVISLSEIDAEGIEKAGETIKDLTRLPFLKRQYRLIVIDLCECDRSIAESIGRLCSSVVVIVEPSRDGLQHARRSIEQMKQAGVSVTGFWTVSTSEANIAA